MTPREDLFSVMDKHPDAYERVRLALVEGRIDGMWPNVSISTRRGCFRAHIMDYLGCADGSERPEKSRQPLDRYTYDSRLGDTPQTSEVIRNTLKWLDEWNATKGFEFESGEGDGVEF